jgi:hypothetical protein
LERYNGIDTQHYTNEEKKIVFIHNPKAAGNTIKDILDISKNKTTHVTPSLLIPKSVWESYHTVMAVRHPFDRLISSYNYHTQKSYLGYYLEKFPNLHNLGIEEYFNIMKDEVFAIRPQSEYMQHLLSEKIVDSIIRYESLEQDLKTFCEKLGMNFSSIPHLNPSSKKISISWKTQKESFKKEVFEFYKNDFETFDYVIH